MALIETKYGRTILKNAESMMVVPYVYDGNVNGYVLGEDVYDISAVIGDSITLEQDDGDSVKKENEFTDVPLLEAFFGMKYAFTAECVDLQNNVLKPLFNTMVGSVSGAVAFTSGFSPRYALIRIRFKENGLPDVIIPKVMLNSKLFINQLKTRVSQGNISGSAMPTKVALKGISNRVLQFSSIGGDSAYTPFTPVLFAPKGYTLMVYHHNGVSGNDYYSSVDFSYGTVSSANLVNSETGIWSIPSQSSDNDQEQGQEGV